MITRPQALKTAAMAGAVVHFAPQESKASPYDLDGAVREYG